MDVINLDDKSKGTHWQKHSCIIEHIPLEVLNKMRDKSITHNIFRIQYDESIF